MENNARNRKNLRNHLLLLVFAFLTLVLFFLPVFHLKSKGDGQWTFNDPMLFTVLFTDHKAYYIVFFVLGVLSSLSLSVLSLFSLFTDRHLPFAKNIASAVLGLSGAALTGAYAPQGLLIYVFSLVLLVVTVLDTNLNGEIAEYRFSNIIAVSSFLIGMILALLGLQYGGL